MKLLKLVQTSNGRHHLRAQRNSLEVSLAVIGIVSIGHGVLVLYTQR